MGRQVSADSLYDILLSNLPADYEQAKRQAFQKNVEILLTEEQEEKEAQARKAAKKKQKRQRRAQNRAMMKQQNAELSQSSDASGNVSSSQGLPFASFRRSSSFYGVSSEGDNELSSADERGAPSQRRVIIVGDSKVKQDQESPRITPTSSLRGSSGSSSIHNTGSAPLPRNTSPMASPAATPKRPRSAAIPNAIERPANVANIAEVPLHSLSDLDDYMSLQHASGPHSFNPEARFLAGATGGDKLGCSYYEIPPGKTSFPRHYHMNIEEALFIISGTGTLLLGEPNPREVPVTSGDYISLLPGPKHCHQLFNAHASEPLKYLAMSAQLGPVDVIEYPDSNKLGVYDPVSNKGLGMFQHSNSVPYWNGEPGYGRAGKKRI